MRMNESQINRWRLKCLPLIGRKITAVRVMTDEERAVSGWGGSPLVLVLDDGNEIWASQDDEGNGPGAIFTTIESIPILPVMR